MEPALSGEFLRGIVRRIIGLVPAVIGATFLVGGLVGAAFKLVTDANIIAKKHQGA